MKNLEQKVEARLMKSGFNPADVKKMMNNNFEEASSLYNTVKSISEYIAVNY